MPNTTAVRIVVVKGVPFQKDLHFFLFMVAGEEGPREGMAVSSRGLRPRVAKGARSQWERWGGDSVRSGV